MYVVDSGGVDGVDVVVAGGVVVGGVLRVCGFVVVVGMCCWL